jgi:hypothetical protein
MAECRLGWMIVLGLAMVVAPSEPAAHAAGFLDSLPVGRAVGEGGGILSGERSRSRAVRYQHDDGDFDSIKNPDSYVGEYAMRYDLPAAGTIVWLEACFELASDAAVQDYVFDFVIYADETRTIWDESNQVYDKGSRPAEVLSGPATIRALLPFSGRDNPDAFACVRHSTDLVVASGSVWVSVRMPGYGLVRQMRVSEADLKVDTRFVSTGEPEWRARDFFGPDSVDRWYPNHQSRSFVPPRRQAYAIRMGVVHEGTRGGSGPLSPGEYTDCHPTSTPLVFDGDYKVSLCYETAKGEVGEAKGGIWASGQSGLLWFFDRGNAEVLIKVLDGCSHNGRRWVFVAPVTDVAFNLHVTDSRGLLWTHRNRLGVTASTRSDTSAFPCE